MTSDRNTFYTKRNDTARSIQATLRDPAGALVDLTGCTVRFILRATSAADGVEKVRALAVIVSPAGVVRYDWQAADVDTAGDFLAEWEVAYPSSRKETFPSNGYNRVRIMADLDGQ